MLLTNERLEDTVLKASLTEEPTKGTKLPMANRAVFNERVSTPCESVLLYDKTNIRIDIVKTVTDVKVDFIIFVTPLKSQLLDKAFTHPNAKQILVIGNK